MGRAAKMDVTAAVRMARAKSTVKNDSGESTLESILKRAMRIYGDLSTVLHEAMDNAADAEFSTCPRRKYRSYTAN